MMGESDSCDILAMKPPGTWVADQAQEPDAPSQGIPKQRVHPPTLTRRNMAGDVQRRLVGEARQRGIALLHEEHAQPHSGLRQRGGEAGVLQRPGYCACDRSAMRTS